jgi:hypothetical protein
MPDASTLPFALTYSATLAVAALMFLGHLVAFIILLALAGTVKLLTRPVYALIRVLINDPPPLKTAPDAGRAEIGIQGKAGTQIPGDRQA